MILPRPGRAARAVAAVALLLSAAACAEPTTREGSWEAFGATLHVRLEAPSERGAEDSLAGVRENVAQAEAVFGTGPDSELARLNAAAEHGFHPIESFDLYKLLLLSLDWAKGSGGAFDPTVGPLTDLYARPGLRVPTETELDLAVDRVGWQDVLVAGEAQAVRFRKPGMRLDLGGIAPGYALDVGARAFARGAQAGVLELGNSVLAWGAPRESRAGWDVALPDPREPGAKLGRVRLLHRAVAASGLGETERPRIFDPRTGRPVASDVAAAIAIADTAGDADAVATALYVLGSRGGGDLLERTRRVEALLVVTGAGEPYALASASLRGRLTVDPALLEEVGGRVRYLLPPSEVRRYDGAGG